MGTFTGRWVAHHKGGPGRVFEVAVVREDNVHGFASYGWFLDDEKLYIAGSGGPCNYKVSHFVWGRLLALAEEYADRLNATCPKCGGTGAADSGGVQPWGESILIPCDCQFNRD